VDDQSVAKQWLGKQTSKIESVFYGVRPAAVAVQWFGKHVSTREGMFSMGSVDLKIKRRYGSGRVLSSRRIT
jgi:hypothetical protein